MQRVHNCQLLRYFSGLACTHANKLNIPFEQSCKCYIADVDLLLQFIDHIIGLRRIYTIVLYSYVVRRSIRSYIGTYRYYTYGRYSRTKKIVKNFPSSRNLVSLWFDMFTVSYCTKLAPPLRLPLPPNQYKNECPEESFQTTLRT